MRVELPPVAASAAQARSTTRQVLDDWGLTSFEETVTLLVTELVSNGVRHARTSLVLMLDYEGTCLRVSVTDGAQSMPVTRGKRTRFGVGGWGLDMIDALAARWSVDACGAGEKTVWFEVDTRTAPPAARRASPAKGAAYRVERVGTGEAARSGDCKAERRLGGRQPT
jgi:hypothetical protein